MRANRLVPLVNVTAIGIILTVKVTLGNEQASDALMDIDVMAGNKEIGHWFFFCQMCPMGLMCVTFLLVFWLSPHLMIVLILPLCLIVLTPVV